MDTHIMVDLETLSNDVSNGVVLSIGAVRFDLSFVSATEPVENDYNFGIRDDLFYTPVGLQSSLLKGFQIEADTLQWWLDPKRIVAFSQIIQMSEHVLDVYTAFAWFRDWMMERCGNDKKSLYVWSHGATYDAVHIERKFTKLGIVCPFDFRNVRDTRTLFALYKDVFKKEIEWPEKKRNHHALEDAWVQATLVSKAWYALCNHSVMATP